MRWFKHMSDASEDEFISALESEFGDSGFAWWWRMVEKIAKQMDGSKRCWAEYPIDRWMGFLHIKRRNNLENFLKFSAENSKIFYEFSGDILKINCPKLLELRDEYSRKSGQTPERLRIRSVSVSDYEYVDSNNIQEEESKYSTQ